MSLRIKEKTKRGLTLFGGNLDGVLNTGDEPRNFGISKRPLEVRVLG